MAVFSPVQGTYQQHIEKGHTAVRPEIGYG